MIKSLLKRLPFTKQLVRDYENSIIERDVLGQRLEQLTIERAQFIESLYLNILQRVPAKAEVNNWAQTNLSFRDLLIGFTESVEYKRRIKIPSQNKNLLGVLTQHENPQTFLLYPSFDQTQLSSALEGKPYQLEDFNSCMDFLTRHNLLNSAKKGFLDIGANVGSSSIYAIKSDFFTHAISIEPSRLNYQFLTWNIQINGLSGKIHPLNIGIADFTGEQNLICSPNNCGDFRLSSDLTESKNLFNEKEFGFERAQFFTLDELARTRTLDPQEIGFIWIDCQGSEGLIFKKGQHFLYEAAAPIYIEFWPYGINQIGCKIEYFEFISKYSSKILKSTGQEMQPISVAFLEDYYAQNMHDRSSFDILILPYPDLLPTT